MLKQNNQISEQAKKEINWFNLEQFVRDEIKYLKANRPMEVKQFSEGYSNLTFLIKVGDWEAVLRRPPFGKTPPKAHDVEREFRLLEKINPVFPLAPKPFLYNEDLTIMDKHFYIMEKKSGIVLDDSIPKEYEKIPNIRTTVSHSVVDTLVQLHEIDYKEAGLSEIGKPEGYVERQVYGWIKRYQNSKTDEVNIYSDIEKWLTSNIPISPSATIVHNDFKLNNMMLSTTNPGQTVGVFDWELSTIGDPLTDLAAAVTYWKDENDPFTAINSVTTLGGFISRSEFVERYARKSGRDLSNFDFYLALAYFKTATILQQIYYRWKKGYLKDDRFSNLNVAVSNLMMLSHDIIRVGKK